MYSLLIKNARLVDGSGGPERQCDIAIENDQIVAIDSVISAGAETVIDAAGFIVAPGFIDVQNHSDSYWQLFDNPGLDAMLCQGFTTIMVGHCGASLAPLLSPAALLPLQKWHDLSGINTSWRSFAEFAEVMKQQKLGVNVASLVGYATLRRGLIGEETRPLAEEERKTILNVIDEALGQGAFGLSSGLTYAHEVAVSSLELADALTVVKKHDALFSVHLRNEQEAVVESVEEVVTLANHTGVRTKISHLKVRGVDTDRKLRDLLSILDSAKHQGSSLFFDLYPYETLWQPVHTYLPKWAIVGGRGHLLKTIHDSVDRKKLLQYINSLPVDIKQFVIASTSNRINVAGKTLGEIAQGLEVSSEQALVDLIDNGGSELMVFSKELDLKQVQQLLDHPLSLIGSDGAGFSAEHSSLVKHHFYEGLVHPRCFGAAPRFMSMALDAKRKTLPEIIRKLTSDAALVCGIEKRGSVAVGYFADLVIFDEAKFQDVATLQNPFQHPTGMQAVIVNGTVAFAEGLVQESYTGKFLTR